MKKLLSLLLFCTLYFFAGAQNPFPINSTSGTSNSGVLTRGRLSVDSLLQINTTCFADTTAANKGRIDEIPGAVIRLCNNTLKLRNNAATAWITLGGGAGSISSIDFNSDSTVIICYGNGVCDTISMVNSVFATYNYVDSSITMNVNQGNCNGVSPGGNLVTWSNTGLKFYITAGNFSIQCRNYFGESDSVTLAAADPTNPRFDAIYRDTSGNVGVITGTPAANPAFPQVNLANQVALTFVLVEAGATTPSAITNRLIYDENLQVAGGEWNTLATNINVDPNQTPVASHLIRSTHWNGVYALGAAYTNSGNIAVSSQDILWFKILFEGFNMYNSTQENIIAFGLTKDASPAPLLKGVTYIKHGINGFDTTNKTNWQTIAIPLSQFLNPYEGYVYTLDSVYSLGIAVVASDSIGGGAVFYIDEINLQSGLVQTGAPPGIYVNDVYSTPSALTDTLWKVRNGDTTVVNIYDRNCGIMQPGSVTWDSLLVFSVSPSIYRLCCDGVRRTSVQSSVTLPAADATLNRFDGIFLDSSGVVVVEGTPATDAAQPQPTECQLILTYIYVPAGSTTPGDGDNGCGLPGKEIIYDETGGSEWDTTASIVTVNFNNTVNPYHFVKAVDVSAFSTFGSAVTFTKGSTITLSNYSAIKFFIRLKSSFGGNTYIGARFLNSSNNLGTTTAFIQNGQFNFQRTVTGSYQEITIPMSIFLAGASTITVDRLSFFLYGSNSQGFYIDYIQLQEGICQPPNSTGGTVTSVSAGGLSPLFSTSVTNATTTPAINFFLLSPSGGTVFGNPSSGAAAPVYTTNPVLGRVGTTGTLGFSGLTSGTVTIQPQAAAGTFNFNLPTTAGTATYLLTSQGGGSTAMTWTDPSTLGATGANPTGTVGLTAVNGVATTFLRSDGAPPLDQAIVPTWTGIHTFNNKVLMLDGRFEYDKGADVAAANDLTLGTDGNLFTITGNTQINAITTANWQAGSQIALIFTGTPTLKNNTSGGAGTATLLLAGRVDFVAAAGDYIGLQYDGTNWYETNRKLVAAVYTASLGVALLGNDFRLANNIKTKGLFVEYPSASESVGMWQTPVAITVSSLKAVLVGSSTPSVTYNIYFGTDRTSGTNVFTSDITCTSTTTGCSNTSGFNDATIPAGSFIWFTTSAQSGTVTQIEITINFTED